MPSIMILLLGGYALVDSFSLGVGEIQRYCYVLLCLVTLVLTTFSSPKTKDNLFSNRVVQVWIFAILVGFLMIPFQSIKYPIYILGDALTFSLPLIFLVYARRDTELFTSPKSIRWLSFLLLFATFFATLFPFISDSGSSRFKEPFILLMSLVWVGLSAGKTSPSKLLYAAATLAIVFLTLHSGARFSLLIWLAMGITIFALGYASKLSKRIALAGGLSICLLIAAGFAETDLQGKLEDLRIGSVVQRIISENSLIGLVEDGSMQNRMLESDDALYTRFHHHTWPEYFFGSGHGATYESGYAYYEGRALDNGSVHHIHFGLVLLYFRYGIAGLILYGMLCYANIRNLLLLRRANQNHPLFKPSLVFCLASMGYLLNMLLFNQLVDPLGSFALAGQLTIWMQLEKQANKNRNKISTSGLWGMEKKNPQSSLVV